VSHKIAHFALTLLFRGFEKVQNKTDRALF